eukprot:3112350-Pleurochrysis_carterae.AAC.1
MFITASLHYRSDNTILMYGWTMPCKWGHPVATLPVKNGTIRQIRRMTEILRIITPSPGTIPVCRVPILTTSGPTGPCSNEKSCWVPIPTTRP